MRIRPITPADREIEAAFVRGLSPESRYARFHSGLRELTPELHRYAASPPGSDSAEVAVVVADDWQGCGIGTRLLLTLRSVAHAAGLRHLHMRVLPQNRRMIDLATRLGFLPLPSDEGYGSRILGKSLEDPGPADA